MECSLVDCYEHLGKAIAAARSSKLLAMVYKTTMRHKHRRQLLLFAYYLNYLQIRFYPVAVYYNNTQHTNKQTNKHTPWSESTSKLYRPSDRRLSAK
jgi:hypothetical protein